MSDRKKFSQGSITNTFSSHCGKKQEETATEVKVEIQEVTVSQAAGWMDAILLWFSFRQRSMIASSVKTPAGKM